MNEITKIHLGSIAYTISVDAYKDLNDYLDDIRKQVKDKEIVEEVELRMSEILSEHGIDTNRVILASDVTMLKDTLGLPDDFKDEDDEDDSSETETKSKGSKKLFRDTDNALVAGVASGIANYLGIDVLLVRLLFVAFVIVTVGWGILLYILLWLLIPEAKTPSDYLLMEGKAVTVKNIKQVINQADIKGTAKRASRTIAGPINMIFRLLLKAVGGILVLFGLTGIFALISGEIYLLVNSNLWQRYNIFPIGFREYLLLDIAAVVAALIAVFIIVIGIAIIKKKWPIKTWVSGVLVGLIFVGLAIGGPLVGNVYPNVNNRYNANSHSSLRSVAPFNGVDFVGETPFNLNYQTSSKYYVLLNYYGHPDLDNIKTSVSGKTLTVDTSRFNPSRNCRIVCFPNTYDLQITIMSPDAIQLENEPGLNQPGVPSMPGSNTSSSEWNN